MVVRGRSAWCILTVVAFSCARPAPEVTPSRPILLAIVTWNLHAGKGDLPQLIDELSSGGLTGGPVANYILLLQEAIEGGPGDVQQIAHTRTLNAWFSAVRRGPRRTSGNAILSTLPLRDLRAIDLPRERQPRAAIAATVDVGGERLFVVNAHLENRLAWMKGFFGDRARGRQADALLRALPQGHGILGGDLNTMLGPDEPAWRALLARFDDTPPDPTPTFHDRLVLDHLFFDVPDGWVVTRRVIAQRYGSDHHPVLAMVRW